MTGLLDGLVAKVERGMLEMENRLKRVVASAPAPADAPMPVPLGDLKDVLLALVISHSSLKLVKRPKSQTP